MQLVAFPSFACFCVCLEGGAEEGSLFNWRSRVSMISVTGPSLWISMPARRDRKKQKEIGDRRRLIESQGSQNGIDKDKNQEIERGHEGDRRRGVWRIRYTGQGSK